MSSNRSPEMLTNELRRRHEYTGTRQEEEQRQRCRRKRRDPARDLGDETMRAANEQHQESLKRLVDHVWEDYHRIKSREDEGFELVECSNQQSAQSKRSASSSCRARSPPSTLSSRRDASSSPSRGASGYRGLSGLNERYQDARRKHALEARKARNCVEGEMTQRRLIDAMTNPRPDNQHISSEIRKNDRQPRVCQTEVCESDTGDTDYCDDDSEFEDLRDFEEYVKAEAARLDAALQAVENDLLRIASGKARLEASPRPCALEPSRPKQPPPPSQCQCSPRQQSPRRAPPQETKRSDSVMELHPFKSRTPSGRQWTDTESKSTVQFMQFDDEVTTTSCSEASAPNTDDMEVVEHMLMELESNLQTYGGCNGPCNRDASQSGGGSLNDIEKITKMVAAEDRDVGLALKIARKLPANKAAITGRCLRLRSTGDEMFLVGEVEDMTPELAAKMMEAEEQGLSVVSPPHKMFSCLFSENAIEPMYGVGSITNRNNLVVPLHGSQYQTPISSKDIADMSMMSNVIRPDMENSSLDKSLNPNNTNMAQRGSLVDSADIVGWTNKADSPCQSGMLTSFEKSGDNALVYTLKPEQLATSIRLRGSVKPAWFPGYYMMLPSDAGIKLASSSSQVLTEIHNAVGPETFNLPKKRVCRC